MLSTENPSVDLSCSSSSQLIKSSTSKICNDEKDSVHVHQQLQDKLDLLKPAIDDDKKPALNFSIRDYVFSTRDKDIETHWPFALKNLQLCLKHGISNVLPPFQTPHSVRNPSTVVSKAQEYPNLSIPTSSKFVRNTQDPVTKCKLTVKACEPKPSKESMKTNAIVYDSMASKVCPVCKTFSSSSNTTLNAHIDQCLSCGPTSNGLSNSRTIKHRIKPRKTRLMVDIYETALCCTLEDLDRRNGTNWASNSKQAMDLEATSSVSPMGNEDKSEALISSANVPDHKDVEGAVYVDSTGTKLRILSKFSDKPCNANGMDDGSPKKIVKGDKGYEFLSSKKMKYPLQNRKRLNTSSRVKILHRNLEAMDGTQKDVYSKEDFNKCGLSQPLELNDRMKSDDFGLVKKWVGSKRTYSKKKLNNMVHERHRMHQTTKGLRVMDRLSTLRDREFGNDSSLPLLSEKITSSSAESCKRKENLTFDSHNGHGEQRCLRKRTEHNHCGKKNNLPLIKHKDSQKLDTSEHKSCDESPTGSKDRVCSKGEKQIITNASPMVRMSQSRAFSSGTKELSQKNPSLDHKILPSAKFSSLERNLPPDIIHASVLEPKKSTLIKRLQLKKRRLRYASESDEESIVHRSAICRRDELIETLGEDSSQREKLFNKPSDNRYNKDLTAQKNRLAYANSDFSTSIGSAGLCIGKNADSYVCNDDVATCSYDTENAVKEAQNRKEVFGSHATSVVAEGTDFTAFDRYLDPLHYVNTGNEVTRSELVFVDERETFPTENDDNMVISNTNALIETDCNEEERGNYESLDPIPIPGPPGSFLPSPGRMGSDELQGSSSLTTCRLHSSEDDEHEVVDMDSSDSPTSVVSNSIVDRSDSVSIIDPSKDRSAVQGDIQCDRDAKIDHAAESSAQFDQTRKQQDSEFKANTMMLSETSQHGLIRNSQSSCCSRKYGVCQSDYFDYQEPLPVLRQCTVNSISLHPAQEKQVDRDTSFIKLDSFTSRSELLNAKELPISETHKVITNSATVSHSYYESPPPSTPNPVLRLMGKNLMVVNNEESFSSEKLRPIQAATNRHLGSRSLSDKNMEHGPRSYNTILNQGASMLDNGQTTVNAIECDVGGGFWKPELFPQKSFNGSFTYHDHLTSNVRTNTYISLCEAENKAGLSVKPLNHHHTEVSSLPSTHIDILKNHPLNAHKTQSNHPCTSAEKMVLINAHKTHSGAIFHGSARKYREREIHRRKFEDAA